MTPVPAIAPLQPNTPPAPGQDPPTSSPNAPLFLPVSPSQPPTPYDFIQTNQLSELDPYYGNPYDPRNCDVADLSVYLRETGQFDEFDDEAEENWYTSDEGERTPNAQSKSEWLRRAHMKSSERTTMMMKTTASS